MLVHLAAVAPAWLWLAAGLLLALAEIVVPGVFLIWLGAAALVTATATAVLPLGLAAQLILFAVAALVAVYAARRYLIVHPIASDDPLLNDRMARLIGEAVTVVDPIRGGVGRVQVGDGVWPACGPDADVGVRMRVAGGDGTRLVVVPDRPSPARAGQSSG